MASGVSGILFSRDQDSEHQVERVLYGQKSTKLQPKLSQQLCFPTAKKKMILSPIVSRFPSNPLIIRVPFFLIFGFNKGTPN